MKTRPVLLCLVLAALASPRSALAQYVAVFVDGRILRVAGARLVGELQIRLELPGGGAVEVPLSRIDRVVADVVEPAPKPIPPPSCPAGFAQEKLPPRMPFAVEIVAASRSADLNPRLVAAVVEAESAFNPHALSRVGAAGLMQLMPSVWLPRGVTNPYDPATNLRLGCAHLRSLLDKLGKLPLALAAYNAGLATVEKGGGMPPYRETREFVRAVLERFCPNAGGGL